MQHSSILTNHRDTKEERLIECLTQGRDQAELSQSRVRFLPQRHYHSLELADDRVTFSNQRSANQTPGLMHGGLPLTQRHQTDSVCSLT
ncbi:hypothetical protein BaRGS_00007484 [Batillaria attramentaria]|uniref:Uncharacterized protein n=1 Tax=Batillaria attramentaria TaxID=370345 RepID=A0ABD0LPE4_9CAEN